MKHLKTILSFILYASLLVNPFYIYAASYSYSSSKYTHTSSHHSSSSKKSTRNAGIHFPDINVIKADAFNYLPGFAVKPINTRHHYANHERHHHRNRKTLTPPSENHNRNHNNNCEKQLRQQNINWIYYRYTSDSWVANGVSRRGKGNVFYGCRNGKIRSFSSSATRDRLYPNHSPFGQ